jgi:hypothetical protein
MATANFRSLQNYPLYVIVDISIGEEGDFLIDEIKYDLSIINQGLYHHKIELLDGYYHGIQLYVDEQGYDDDEEVKREAILVEAALKKIAENYGFIELKVVGRFSNGETVYERVVKEAK